MRGSLTQADMLETFNLGLGMILIVKANQVDATMTMFQDAEQPAFIIGEMVARESEPIIWQGAQPW